ncbi:MAG: response regulator [Gemmatimonadales bacterium]
MVRHSQPRILVLDSEPAVRRLLARFLQGRGCEVEEVGSGEEGLVALVGNRFDAVVSEITMPGMDARQFWQVAVSEQPELRGRFVFVSAAGPLPAPGVRYVAKPFDLERLWAEVEAVLHGEDTGVPE